MYNRFPIQFKFDGRQYRGEIKPLTAGIQNRKPVKFQVFLNNIYYGDIRRNEDNWETDSPKCAIMVETLGNHIYDWYMQVS